MCVYVIRSDWQQQDDESRESHLSAEMSSDRFGLENLVAFDVDGLAAIGNR